MEKSDFVHFRIITAKVMEVLHEYPLILPHVFQIMYSRCSNTYDITVISTYPVFVSVGFTIL